MSDKSSSELSDCEREKDKPKDTSRSPSRRKHKKSKHSKKKSKKKSSKKKKHRKRSRSRSKERYKETSSQSDSPKKSCTVANPDELYSQEAAASLLTSQKIDNLASINQGAKLANQEETSSTFPNEDKSPSNKLVVHGDNNNLPAFEESLQNNITTNQGVTSCLAVTQDAVAGKVANLNVEQGMTGRCVDEESLTPNEEFKDPEDCSSQIYDPGLYIAKVMGGNENAEKSFRSGLNLEEVSSPIKESISRGKSLDLSDSQKKASSKERKSRSNERSRSSKDKESRSKGGRSRSKDRRSRALRQNKSRSRSKGKKSRSKDKRSRSASKSPAQRPRKRSSSKSRKTFRRSRTRDRSKDRRSRERSHSLKKYRSKSRERGRSKSREHKRSRSRERSRSYERYRYNSGYQDYSRYRQSRSSDRRYMSRSVGRRQRSRSTERRRRSRSRNRGHRSKSKERYHSRSRYRSRSRSPRKSDRSGDRKKRSQSGDPVAASVPVNLTIALGVPTTSMTTTTADTVKSSKSIADFTALCKKLTESKEDRNGVSENTIVDEELTSQVYHPFNVKPAKDIVIPPVIFPVSKPAEPARPLEQAFPVSSGNQHKTKENTNEATVEGVDGSIAAAEKVFQAAVQTEKLDVSGLIAKRMEAQNRLQSNPHDLEAKLVLEEVQMKIQNWASINLKPGQFTGENLVSSFAPKENINSGYQAWARKDMFHNLAPIKGGVGMRLLQKMGWKPGQVIGKRGEGGYEPIALTVKMDRRGLVSFAEPGGGKGKGGGKGGGKNILAAQAVQGFFALHSFLHWTNNMCIMEAAFEHLIL
ncbi:protein SON-like isoform X2 [Dendronephthya gigantea]|uniref:protein SON-like isoform X2 n=1 Tax=Dendronephthya gigantea TaxID=151771 RepID=UPI00106A78A0|nr:protein SON-like isoform X2 [Dendronephthya gigantea]XP_028410193.1 protein SON-like isoform X2 [Dendronephthya gigantea]XP_028410200.1 protein SON-like isoform X2 [Dendronephthya gigantea]